MSFSSTNNNAHNSNNNDNMASSSFDFVSADLNEVLQDARRQNLTNREQQRDGQHPNERVLDKSTTVQVTKQDSDGGPLEVTVEEAETEERG
jgi:beta-mannanase